jgi:hypothetical protein
MIFECLKEGFNLANRNYQLVFLRITVIIINFLSLLFLLGVPVIAAVAYMGFDLSHAVDLLPDLMGNPFNFLSKYVGLVFLIGLSFIFYLMLASTIILYSLGGTLGVLRNSAIHIQYRFSLSSFFKEANKLFSRLFRLLSFLIFIFIILFTAVIISAGIVAGFIQGFSWTETPLEVFFSSFVMSSIIILSTIFFLIWLIFMVYSILSSVLEGKGLLDSIKNTFNFLKKNPRAFLFFIILSAGAIAINMVFFIIMIPLGMLPFINILLYLVSIVFQNYLSVVVWSSLTVYYIKASNYPVYTATYDI